jgi:hypothetical protein
MNTRSILFATSLISVGVLSGCGGFLNHINFHAHKEFSAARELMELQEARDKKVISDEEFRKLRAKVIKDETGDKK